MNKQGNTSSAVMQQRNEAQAEEWRRVPSHPSYFASSLGRIRGPSGKVLSLMVNNAGYLQVNVSVVGKPALSRRVHTLVCEAFHGPRPTAAHVTAHGDGVRDNCAPSNLRWATRKENHDDMKIHGTWPALEKHPRAQLTLDQAEAIRARHQLQPKTPAGRVPRGWRQRIAAEYGVKVSCIKDILHDRTWIPPCRRALERPSDYTWENDNA